MILLEQLRAKLRNSLSGEIDQTIVQLKEVLSDTSEKYTQLILLEGRYNDVRRLSIIGTTSEEDRQREVNRIRESCLHLINSLRTTDIITDTKTAELAASDTQPQQNTLNSQASKNTANRTGQDHLFQAQITSQRTSSHYLSIEVKIHNETHLLEYKEVELTHRLYVNGQVIEQKGVASLANIFLSGFTFGAIKEKKTFHFRLPHDKNTYSCTLELTFDMSRNFSTIRLLVKGIELINVTQ